MIVRRWGQLGRMYEKRILFVVVALALALILPPMISSWLKGAEPLVVYCAHDAVYSKQILDRFTEETGIAVRFVPDTEATKSLGFVERLIREKDAPRCDVFWNNQLLGTLDLHEKGILQPCKGPGFDRIPDAYKDPDGHWVGFAARFRVYIVNTEKLEATEEAVKARLDAADLSRVAIAKPLYGTTLSHYGILWQRWGGDKLKAWHMGCRDRKIVEATGNAHVKDLVASGVCGLGLTDTDDFFGARDAGKPVEMLPVRLDDDSTICIPNTVCIIKGTRQPLRARQLVDYLLSESTELALAASKARQVPLGPVDDAQLAEEVRAMAPWVADGVPLAGLGPARAECLAWLKGLYVQ